MTRKKFLLLILTFFIPFLLTYFSLSTKQKKPNYLIKNGATKKQNIIQDFFNQTSQIFSNTKTLPTTLISPTKKPQTQPTSVISSTINPTITPTPTSFIQMFDVVSPTPTPTIKLQVMHIITKTPTPTPKITISRLSVVVGTYTATISFNTSSPCSSQIFYGEARAGGNLPKSEILTSHSTTLHLEEGTSYVYQIKLFPSKTSGVLLYEGPISRFTTHNAKRYQFTLETIEIIKDGLSSGPGNFKFYLGVRDPAHPGLVTCCGFLNSFTASDGQTVTINKTFLGGGAEHGTPITVYLDEDSQADPGQLYFSFEAPFSGPDQDYKKTVTSSEKNGIKYKATFRIVIFDD